MANKIPPINFTISIGIYPYDLMVSIGEEDKPLLKKLKKIGVVEDADFCDYGENGAMKYAVWPKYQQCLIRMRYLPKTSSDYAGVAHEVLHVVISVLRNVGMRIEDGGGSDEAYTYLMSMLIKSIYEEINQYY